MPWQRTRAYKKRASRARAGSVGRAGRAVTEAWGEKRRKYIALRANALVWVCETACPCPGEETEHRANARRFAKPGDASAAKRECNMHAQKTGALSAKSDRSGRRPQAERASVAGKPLTAGSGAQDFPALPACALGSSVGEWMRPENFRSGRRGTRRGLCAWRALKPKTARRNARPRPWHEYVLWRRRDPAFRRAGGGGESIFPMENRGASLAVAPAFRSERHFARGCRRSIA